MNAIGLLVSAFMYVLPAIKAVLGGVWQYAKGMWSIIVGIFTSDGGRIREGLGQIWIGINAMLAGWPAKLRQAGVDMVLGLIGGLRSMLGKAGDAVAGVGSAVIGRFKSLLGINSPSRVFAQLGGWTMEGLANGLQAAQRGPLGAMQQLGDRMRAVGASAALGAAVAMPAAAAAPVKAPRAAGTVLHIAGDTITIQVTAAPGMDPAAIARGACRTGPRPAGQGRPRAQRADRRLRIPP